MKHYQRRPLDVLEHQEYIDDGHYTAKRGHRNHRYNQEEAQIAQAEPAYEELTAE